MPFAANSACPARCTSCVWSERRRERRSVFVSATSSAGNNLSGFASQFATQNIHSWDANLAPSAKNHDTFLRTHTCPGGSTGGRQLDYARTLVVLLLRVVYALAQRLCLCAKNRPEEVDILEKRLHNKET